MKPEIESQELNAFVDGELEVFGQREIEERMAHDAGLRAQVEALRRLRESLRAHADYHVAPEAFRRRIAALAAAPAAPPRAPFGIGIGTLRRWFDWRPLAVSFAAMAAAMALAVWTLIPAGWRSGNDDRLEREVVASHVRSALGQHLVDVASSNRHTVKPWLSSKLDFSPPVQEALLPGSVFLGGRVDYLDGRPVAALVYRQREHVVSSFVWPTAAADGTAVFSAQKGFQIARWSRGGMSHWVISDVNREEFGAIVRAIEENRGPP